MIEDIFLYLENQNVKYDLNKLYINSLFLELREFLKVFYKRYNLKKKTIVKIIYKYFTEKLHIQQKIIDISKLKQPEQRTEEWYNMRYNMITASDAATVIGTKTQHINEEELKKISKHSPFKSKNDLLKTKIDRNDEFKGNKYTEHGQIFEPIASLIYEKINNTNIIEFGLIQHPNIEIIGASPDGITKEGIMIEIKAPYKRVINGIIPSNYWIQMQFQLEVCNLEICHFVEIKSLFYKNKEEYDKDTNNIDLKTKDNLDKGIILKCSDNNNNIYYYPNTNEYKNTEELNKWVNNRIIYYKTIHETVEILYWKIDKYSCTEVKRDKNWFIKNLNLFKEFWKQIDYYKNNMEEYKKKVIKTKINIQEDVCMITDSDDESDNLKSLLENINKDLEENKLIENSDNEYEKNQENKKKEELNQENEELVNSFNSNISINNIEFDL
jgi:putative phage-type endonuclease